MLLFRRQPMPGASAARADGTDYRQACEDMARRFDALWAELAQVATAVESVNAAVEKQSATFESLSEHAAAMASSGQRVSRTADTAHELIEQSVSGLSESQRNLSESSRNIETLADAVGSGGARLGELTRSMHEVGKVTGAIRIIAKQINLLALNATIEAARAGAAGRGFAVVAEEVKHLAGETGNATGEIEKTLSALTGQVNELIDDGQDNGAKAIEAKQSAEAIVAVMDRLNHLMRNLDQGADQITEAASDIQHRTRETADSISAVMAEVSESRQMLKAARERLDSLLGVTSGMIGEAHRSGIKTADSRFIEFVQERAAMVAATFEAGIASGEIDIAALFDRDYQAVPGSNPPQHMTRYTTFCDKHLPDIQEPALKLGDEVVACVAIDDRGYIPTHMRQYSKPQTDDVAHNMNFSRNRRILTDPVSQQAAANRSEPFMFMTYKAQLKPGVFMLLKEANAPIFVQGRHWGGMRIVYRVKT